MRQFLFALLLSLAVGVLGAPKGFSVDGSCKKPFLGVIQGAAYGECLVTFPGEHKKTTFYCEKGDACPDEGTPCSVHCTPSPYGGSTCLSSCS